MKNPALAAIVIFAVSSAAWAVETPLPNGTFEANNPATGFGQTITNWTVNFAGVQPAALTGQYSGLFTSFGKFNATSNAGTFVVLTNEGAGTTTLTSGALGVNFAVNDRLLAFLYAYLTNDIATNARDQFRVHIDFFSTATGLVQDRGFIDLDLTNASGVAKNTDSAAGFSPFGGVNNLGAVATYNNATGSALNLIALDISSFFGSFARVSFIVNNVGAAAGTNGNGLGVSGIVLNDVILTPEPSTFALFAAGIAGLGGLAWRRRSAAKKPA